MGMGACVRGDVLSFALLYFYPDLCCLFYNLGEFCMRVRFDIFPLVYNALSHVSDQWDTYIVFPIVLRRRRTGSISGMRSLHYGFQA